MKKVENADDIICPICGYYCLGNGGFGCIDKPSFFKPIIERTPNDPARQTQRRR